MKKKNFGLIFLVIIAMIMSIGLVACNTSHRHTYSEKWEYDDTHHWHKATCEHDVVDAKKTHDFGEWVVVKPATQSQKGSQKKVCKTCGFEVTEDIDMLQHAHTFSKSWTFDETYHWHDSDCGHDVISDKSRHQLDGNGCKVCEYVDLNMLYNFEEVEENGEVTGYSIAANDLAKSKTQLVIPQSYNGKPVIAIAEQGLRDISAKTVTIPSNIKYIGNYAFFNSAIEEVVIPDSVMEMGAIFYQCKYIRNVIIGNGVKTIEKNTFRETPALESVKIGNSVNTMEDYVFYKSGIQSIELPDSVKQLGKTFYGAEELISVKIGSGIRELSDYLFCSCASLKTVEMGQNVTAIGSNAFLDCSSLNEINLDTVTSIGNYAFDRCSNLYSVTLGENLTSIGSGAFLDTYKLIEVCNKSSMEIDYKKFFNYAQNKCVNENQKGVFVTTEEGYLFYSFKDEEQIKSYLINYEGKETKLTLPSPQSVKINSKAIDSYVINFKAFAENTAITDVVVSDGITEIYSGAFMDCSQLENVTFGKDLTTIKTRAFQGCGITTLVVPEAITTIEIYAFLECSSLKRIEWNAIDCAALDYTLINNNKGIFQDGTKNSAQKSVETIVFGNKVQKIPAYTFRYMENVTSIYIPASVKVIEKNAFHKCGLTNVEFAVTSGWSVTNSTWGSNVTKNPNFSDKEEIISWLSGDYTSSTTWTHS